jgi:Zn-dependent metalloprotease
MKKKYHHIATALLIAFGISITEAQAGTSAMHIQNAEIVGVSAQTGLPNFIRFNPGKELLLPEFDVWAARSLGTGQDLNFKSYKTETDQLGVTHTRYRQYYHSYPVEGTTLICHSKNGRVISVNGDYVQEVRAALSASLTPKQALKKALEKVHASRYRWENADEEEALRKAFNDPNLTYYPKGELVVVHVKGADYSAASYHLAYKFNIYADIPLYRSNVFVDANSGKILDEQNLICTTDVVGPATTKYSGTVPMTSDNYGTGQYRLRETGRGNGIETYNLNGSSTYTNTDFTNTSSTWNSTGNDQAATDAHWGAEQTYDYYKQTYNRNSIDGNGYKLLSYVHYSTNFVNAYWDGTEMTYGDGNLAQGFSIMTALDVCGHEITHGLTANTAALGSGEAGALNEGFSDIFGTTIEHFARPNQWDWLIGADITTNHAGLRNMSNPKQFTQPDTYLGTNWDPNGEVHNNNGPCIFWYYLMCQGKSGTNDIGSVYNVSAIGMTDAAQIAFRALTVYFTPSTDYNAARIAAIQASTDLFGSCSPQTITCTNAWYAVGVGSQYAASAVVSAFSANTTASCALPATVQFTNATANGASYSWSFGDGTGSTAVNPVHSYTQSGTFTVKLVALGCTGVLDSVIKTSYITISAPTAPTATGASRCGSGSLTLSASGAGTINWYSSAAADTILGTGTSFNTPVITTTTSFYAASSIAQAPVSGGPDSTLGTGSYLNYSHYLVFDVSDGLTIKSVDVYPSGTGARTIELQNSAGTTLISMPVNNLPASGKTTVPLNFHVPAGTGYHLAATGATINMFRNNAGAVYPYNIGSIVSVTGTDVSSTSPAYYYFFYNWVIEKDPCISTTVPAVATITPSGGNISVNSVSVCPGVQATLTATGGTSYSWSTGSSNTSINVTPSLTTTYTVSGNVPGCVGTTSAIGTVHVYTAPAVATTPASLAVCTGATGIIGATGASTYSWSTGSLTNSITVPSSPATYTVTGTDVHGCTGVATVNVTVSALPVITFSLVSDTLCVNHQNIVLNGSPAGGFYTGRGITGNTFNPLTANLGIDTLVYTYTSGNGCAKSKSIIVKIDACTGIATYDIPTILVYPNPASDYVVFKNFSNSLLVKIYDAAGKVVLEESAKGTDELKIGIAQLAQGLYQISMTSNDRVSSERLVIQR